MQLHEQYRPKTWGEVVGQDKTVKVLTRLAKRGLGGRAFWISGSSGTGKTTIAKLLAADVADDFNIDELDASEATAARLREMERGLQCRGLGTKDGRAVLVNESHGLRKDAIRQLLVILERLPAHVICIFTTTSEAQQELFEDSIDANPLLSRCIKLELSRRGLADAFAQRAQEIAEREGLGGAPAEKYLRAMKDARNNLRAVLQRVESGDFLE